MRPVYEATGKVDGYVSLEVSPYLALHTDETVAEARKLWKAVGRENLMVKVPGTDKGVAAIRTLIGEGLNINVTLLFGQAAYEAVAEAFIAGLEDRMARGESVAGISSVASFFVSRIDAVIDKRIDDRVKAGETAHCPRCAARSPSPTPRWPTRPISPWSRARAGRSSPLPARCRSGCSGPAPE